MIKPAVEQVCNTHECIEVKCPNYISNPNGASHCKTNVGGTYYAYTQQGNSGAHYVKLAYNNYVICDKYCPNCYSIDICNNTIKNGYKYHRSNIPNSYYGHCRNHDIFSNCDGSKNRTCYAYCVTRSPV